MLRSYKRKSSSTIRIIGGRWRGSRLHVLDRKGLRPTPDRVRETLFNWLSMDISGARVLDCFAGAGGLGFEGASRGAQNVTMVEIDRKISANLNIQCERLQADNISIENRDILEFLDQSQACNDPACYDLVFIDPPYAAPELRSATLQKLIERHLLSEGAKIYLEWPLDQKVSLNDFELTGIRQKITGHINYTLAKWSGTG